MNVCGERREAMGVEGVGYVECVLPAGHRSVVGWRCRYGPLVVDGGAWAKTRGKQRR